MDSILYSTQSRNAACSKENLPTNKQLDKRALVDIVITVKYAPWRSANNLRSIWKNVDVVVDKSRVSKYVNTHCDVHTGSTKTSFSCHIAYKLRADHVHVFHVHVTYIPVVIHVLIVRVRQ